MGASAKWLIVDDNGVTHQPWVKECLGNYGCGSMSPVYETERQAVLAYAIAEKIDVVEIIAPYTLSIKARCERAIDNLWERVRLMGEAEGGKGTGGTVAFVIDDSGAVEEEEWTADDCDAALEGIRLAASALQQLDVAAETEGL